MLKIIEVLKKYKGYFICIIIILLSVVSIFMQNLDRKNTLKVNNKDKKKIR